MSNPLSFVFLTYPKLLILYLIMQSKHWLVEDMIDYISNLYNGNSTRIKINSNLSDKIRLCRGVKQVDPFSPLLFNSVIDYCVDGRIEEYAIKVDSLAVTYLAFADDIVVFLIQLRVYRGE